MDIKKTVKLAGEAIDAECQRLAVNANLYERYRLNSGRHAWERRNKLREVKSALEALAQLPRQMKLEDAKHGGDSEKV